MAESKRILTEMQVKFIEALFSEESMGKPHIAKKMAGYADSIQTGELIKSLSEEIIEYGKRYVAANSGRAVFGLFNVLDNPTEAGQANRLKAATEILDRAGLAKKGDNDTLKIPETGLVILPAKKVSVEVDVES